jgi:flagellar capping protein FliD
VDNTVLTALISTSGAALVAITALLLNYRGFAAIDSRLASLDSRVNSLESRVDMRFNSMQADMKDLNKAMTALEIDVALVKDKVGL